MTLAGICSITALASAFPKIISGRIQFLRFPYHGQPSERLSGQVLAFRFIILFHGAGVYLLASISPRSGEIISALHCFQKRFGNQFCSFAPVIILYHTLGYLSMTFEIFL